MAEIKIEKKKPIWPWVILAILLALILYFIFAGGTDDDDGYDDDATTEQVSESDDYDNRNENEDGYANEDSNLANSDESEYGRNMSFAAAVSAYTDYIDNDKMGIDHEYSHGALSYLINAVDAKANDLDVDISVDLEKARQQADNITTDPYEVNHADIIKESGLTIVNALETIQEGKFPNLKNSVSKVAEDVEAIDKDVHALDQKGSVNMFFKSAEKVLMEMN